MIADVREHGCIERKSRHFSRNGNTRERHQREQARRFQHDRFAAGIRAGDDHRVVLVVQRERHGNNRAAARAQVFFQQWMPRFDNFQRRARFDLRNRTAKLLMKNRLRIDEIQLGNSRRRHFDRRQLRAQIFAQTEKYLGDLACFGFVQTLQFVVGVDRFERLDESGRAG